MIRNTIRTSLDDPDWVRADLRLEFEARVTRKLEQTLNEGNC